jgi:hypothetical protein
MATLPLPCLALPVLWDRFPSGSSQIISYEQSKIWISHVVTPSLWFSWFMSGLHKHVGGVKKRDEAMTIDVVHTIESQLHEEWNTMLDRETKHRIAEIGVCIVGGFCLGLKGKEKLLIECAGTAKSLKHLFRIGTKGNQLSGSKFGRLYVSITTEGSHLRPGIWLDSLVPLVKADGVTGGRVFRRNLSPCKLFEFEHDFFTLIEHVQSLANVIDKDVDVWDASKIFRSLH